MAVKDPKTLKLKRQVRDFYNKHVNDPLTIVKVARVCNMSLKKQ